MCSQNCAGLYKKILLIKCILGLAVSVLFIIAFVPPGDLSAEEHGSQPAMEEAKNVPDIEHPIAKPKMYSKEMRCPNCGMMINMWARTRHMFDHPEGDFTTCSIRCMADKASSSGEEPSKGQVAVYHDPDTMIPVESATYVVGSSAPGTMTMTSKIAFADNESAERFAAEYGGKVVGFQQAYEAARMELPKSRGLIDKKRKKTGKIKEPTEKDSCVVCGMYPARYPRHNTQILTMEGDTLHFCSTKCMVTFNADPAKHVPNAGKTKMAWVKLYSDEMYESAFGAYYVIGSKVDGPMGREAIPFKFKKNAEDFVGKNGGTIVSYTELTPELIGGGH